MFEIIERIDVLRAEIRDLTAELRQKNQPATTEPKMSSPETLAATQSDLDAIAKHRADILATRERIAAYNAGALEADRISDDYGSHGWSAKKVAELLRKRIITTRQKLAERIASNPHNLAPNITASLIRQAIAIGPEDDATTTAHHQPA